MTGSGAYLRSTGAGDCWSWSPGCLLSFLSPPPKSFWKKLRCFLGVPSGLVLRGSGVLSGVLGVGRPGVMEGLAGVGLPGAGVPLGLAYGLGPLPKMRSTKEPGLSFMAVQVFCGAVPSRKAAV